MFGPNKQAQACTSRGLLGCGVM